MQAENEKIKDEKVKAAKTHDLQESESDAVIPKQPSLAHSTHTTRQLPQGGHCVTREITRNTRSLPNEWEGESNKQEKQINKDYFR